MQFIVTPMKEAGRHGQDCLPPIIGQRWSEGGGNETVNRQNGASAVTSTFVGTVSAAWVPLELRERKRTLMQWPGTLFLFDELSIAEYTRQQGASHASQVLWQFETLVGSAIVVQARAIQPLTSGWQGCYDGLGIMIPYPGLY
ncbi:hypothetical protein IF2G_05248 [Cordyceps javanica]|nr:hypothetical protein IF2G_05248 [Cordyceps javanica]